MCLLCKFIFNYRQKNLEIVISAAPPHFRIFTGEIFFAAASGGENGARYFKNRAPWT
jgi:hypothetical protein